MLLLYEKERIDMELIRGNYLSPRWSGEITDCSLPMTLDTYSNCSYGCVYCFSQYQRGTGNGKIDYKNKVCKSIDVEKTKRILSGEDKDSQFYRYVIQKRPIQYGGLSDQFDEFERKYGKTLELLKFLRQIKYPICFSTKAAWVFEDERYRRLFHGADNWNMKFSIITLNEPDAYKIEVGCPTPMERLRAMKEYSMLNKGGATLRLRPFILGVSDRTYVDLIKLAKEHGANAVTTEFFCLEMRSINIAREHYRRISETIGIDIVDFYRKNSEGSGYLRLNRTIKRPYIEKMKELCDKLGMRFYVSDAHFKEISTGSCCCGLPESWSYSRGNFSYALQVAKRNGRVRFSDIANDMYFLDSFEWVYAQGFNTFTSEAKALFKTMTMKQYLRYIWNNPKRGQSPYKLFGGVLVPDGLDAEGDVVYKYNRAATF